MSNFEQKLISKTGRTHTARSPREANDLLARGYRVEPDPGPAPRPPAVKPDDTKK